MSGIDERGRAQSRRIDLRRRGRRRLCGNQNFAALPPAANDLHAIDATPARWRGGAGSSPLDGGQHGRVIAAVTGVPGALLDFHTAVVAGFHAAMRSKIIERRARHAADDREALTALLANMATVENVFDDACRDLTRPAIAARLEAATGRAPSPREVEILFDVFDASHNDKILAARGAVGAAHAGTRSQKSIERRARHGGRTRRSGGGG